MMSASPETLLVVLAISMCSILFLFTIGVVLVFHCCRVKDIHDLPHAVVQRTRVSYQWARQSIFSQRAGSECLDTDDVNDDGFLHPHRQTKSGTRV